MFFRHTRFSYILYTCALTLADEGIRTFRAGKEEESPPGDSGCPAQAKNYRLGRFHIRKQAKRDYNRELAEGELASCPRGLPARKHQRANKTNG